MTEGFSLPGGLEAQASNIRQDGRILRFHLIVRRDDEIIHRANHVVIDKPSYKTLQDVVTDKFA